MKFLKASLLLAMFISMPARVWAEDLALLITNFSGETFTQKSQIERDLPSLEQAYRDAGFSLMTARDIEADQFEDVLLRFEAASRDADRVVVHFVGTLLSSKLNVRLKPSQYRSSSLVRNAFSAPSVTLLFELLQHRPGRNAVILSATNGNGAEIVKKGPAIPNGLLVLVGGPRDTNRAVRDGLLNGRETGVQLNARPNVTAYGFVSDISLLSQIDAISSSATPRQQTAADAALVEMRVWREAAQNGSQAALKGYINRYPNGLFRGEAQARLDALTPPKSIEQTVEENLRLSRTDRRNIQKNLTLLGFNTRGVDGLFGPGSRSAIERWQRKEGFRATGYLDRAQIRVLNEAARVRTEADRVDREREDVAYWQQTGSGTNERGLRDYLAKYPAGLFAIQAKQALERIQQGNQSQQTDALVKRERALQMTPKTRTLVEQRLVGLGYNVGPVDGVFTRETRVAIKSFQQQSGITPTGFMDNQTVTRLVASIFR